MNILILGKFPPIQGGVTRDTYWMTYALAKAGHTVHVVSNATEVEDQFRIGGLSDELLLQDGPLSEVSDRVYLHFTEPKKDLFYIPQANPFVSSLAGLATRVIEQHKCDLIYGYYMEPYGVAACLASSFTGVPFGLTNAGSDVGRLSMIKELRSTYHHVLKKADFHFPSESVARRLLHIGVDPQRIVLATKFVIPRHVFTPSTDVQTPEESMQKLLPDYLPEFEKKCTAGDPIIGIYGKVGLQKGSLDLLEAIAKLRNSGLRVNLIAITQGREKHMETFLRKLKELDLSDQVLVLPFVPHWRIPDFIRMCDAVAFLERNFSIPIHNPMVPMEVWSCGTPLLLSREIAEKQYFSPDLNNFENVVVVEPQNTDELANAIARLVRDPDQAKRIGLGGYDLIKSRIPDFDQYSRSLSETFERFLAISRNKESEMSMENLHACFAYLVTRQDPGRTLLKDPDGLMKDFELSPDEISSLQEIDSKLLEHFSRSLANKTKILLTKHYELTASLLGDQRWTQLFSAFNQDFPRKPEQTLPERLEQFGEFLLSCLSEDKADTLAQEVCLYERIRNRLRMTPTSLDDPELINEGPIEIDPSQIDKSAIRLSPGSEVQKFSYPILDVVRILSDPKSDESFSARETFVLFQVLPKKFNVKTYEINEPTYLLLEAAVADGRVEELYSRAFGEKLPEDEASSARDLVLHLLKKQVLLCA